MSKKKIAKRRFGVRKALQKRRSEGWFYTLIPRMRLEDVETFKNLHRMGPASFDELLGIIGPHITKIPVRSKEEITAAERLAITLRYLASGDSMLSVGFYGFRVGASTTSYIINEICQLVWEKLAFTFPTMCTEMWEQISVDFFNLWGFPNCVGAIDGKHVVIQALPNHNSLTYNYKNSHSLVLMAIADAKYKFIMVDIGALGRNSDSGIFKNSNFGSAILYNIGKLKLPQSKVLSGTNVVAPFVFVGDEAFPLRVNLMRPYPGRNTGNLSYAESVFNFRLSKARRVVENAFGIMASRFRIYRKPIIAKKETVINIIKATVCLHNWLRDKSCSGYFTTDIADKSNEDGSIVPGQWRTLPSEGLQPVQRTGSNYSPQDALKIRQIFTNYFS